MAKKAKPAGRAKAKGDKLSLARRHLERVQAAWDDPTDWDDLSLYGFYCLEAAVEAAARHFKFATSHRHWEKAELAARLHQEYGLPDVSDLLTDLNSARKAAAYGDVESPDLDPQDVSEEIEQYVEAVGELITRGKAK